MNIASFKEVKEISSNKFAESPLGKMSEGKAFDKLMSEYDKPLELTHENIKNCPIEGNNGNWDGERGNSSWIPDREAIPGKSNYENKTWNEILDNCNIEKIAFKDGEPNFNEISKGNVEIESFSTDRSDNFDNADIQLAKQKNCTPDEVSSWRKENSYTWHECRDMRSMQKVPGEVHNNISHRGGISEAKKGNGGF